ncbi:altronate hydrolase [Escherichia coli]|uniref:Altronate hydrolase n=1 Tax=Escherichia coli TaxID=562 RepID=A0A376RD23_ECOLX|nr:altronate hydrolase [Escherichia coli]
MVDVLRYGERLKTPGLNLLSAPGNDAVATSALAGAGCHMVLFSTGRGTPYGGFVPTVKIATNSELAAKKKHWIDFDAGQLIHGKAMPQLLEELSTPSLSLPTVNKPATSVTTSANWRSSKAA